MTARPGDDPRLHFSGVDEDGRPLQEPTTPEELGRHLLDLPPEQVVPPPPPEAEGPEPEPVRAAFNEEDLDSLEAVGWTTVFPAGADPRVYRALEPLLEWRRLQARGRYRDPVTYVPGQTYDQFMERIGAQRGRVNPDRFPFYVLLVGGPDEIPYEIQHQLDGSYGVGRINFARPEDYGHYARGILDVEEGRVRRRREVGFFAPEHEGDEATRLTCRLLVEPLADWLGGGTPKGRGWTPRAYLGRAADKDTLVRLLGGSETPPLLFAAAHGLRILPPGRSDQEDLQGALVTADWPGPVRRVEASHRFAAADLPPKTGPAGLVAFLFACYGAGTPLEDPFFQGAGMPPSVAPRPFDSALARSLLSHPAGAAQAVVGHIERAWTTSFNWYRDGRQTDYFEEVLTQLMQGKPVGAAMEGLAQQAFEFAAEQNQLSTYHRQGRRDRVDPAYFARLWIAQQDLRNFVTFGDPAVRLAVR